MTVKVQNFVTRALKIYDQELVAGSDCRGEECDCRGKNAAGSLAVLVVQHTVVAVDYDSTGFEGH